MVPRNSSKGLLAQAAGKVGPCPKQWMYDGHHAQDDRAAAEWYARAAETGNADGQYHLGYFYYEGRGVPRDFGRAYGLWRQAAAQGHVAARNVLCAEIADFCEE